MGQCVCQRDRIASTGCLWRLQHAGTGAVFGDYISVYDIQRAVDDGPTVPIYCESRLAALARDEAERPKIAAHPDEGAAGRTRTYRTTAWTP